MTNGYICVVNFLYYYNRDSQYGNSIRGFQLEGSIRGFNQRIRSEGSIRNIHVSHLLKKASRNWKLKNVRIDAYHRTSTVTVYNIWWHPWLLVNLKLSRNCSRAKNVVQWIRNRSFWGSLYIFHQHQECTH